MPIVRHILLVAVFLSGLFASLAHAAGPSVLFDPATGEVLSQDRAGEPWYPASLTKLMTAYIVFEKLKAGQFTLEQQIPVSELAHEQPPSKIGVPVGKTVSVDFALQALLVYSANDMAYVLAEAASGSIPAFANEMNVQARLLGMTGSHFVNPNGLFDPRHVTTARDIAILVTALLREFPERNHYFSQPYVAVGKRRLANRNSLIRQMPEADGMKTGFVCNSGFNLVATATHDGKRLGAVIFGANSGKHRADLAQMLLIDGFSRPPAPHVKLDSIVNLQTGAIVPADMTRTVCKRKPITIASAKDLGGWGISFGNYETSATADMALRGRLLSPAGIGLPGNPGIIQMPNGVYAAALWNLDQQQSLAACSRYRTEKAPCDVITPETFAQLAAIAPAPPKVSPAVEDPEGSDSVRANKKSVRKTKKKS